MDPRSIKKEKKGVRSSIPLKERVKRHAIVMLCGLAVGAAFNVAFHAPVYGFEGLLGGLINSLIIYWMA